MNTEAVTPNAAAGAARTARPEDVAAQVNRLLDEETRAGDDETVVRLLGDAHQALLEALGSVDGS